MAQWTSSDAETRPALSDQEWLASHRRACNYSRGHRRNRLGMTGPRRYRHPSSILPRREGPAAWRLGTGREPGAGHGCTFRTWDRHVVRARAGNGSVRRDERVRRFRATCPRPSTRRQRIAAAYGCATQTRPSASPAAVRTGAQWLLMHDQALSGHRTVRGTRRGPGQKRRPCLRPASSGRTYPSRIGRRPLFPRPFLTVAEPAPGLLVPLSGILASRRRKPRKNEKKRGKNGRDMA